MSDKNDAQKVEAPKAGEPDVSKAQQDRLDEYRRTHKVPSGYSYNVRDGLHKTPRKGK